MTYSYTVVKEKNVANVSPDRIFKLSPIEEGAKGNVRSMVNANMFKGDKRLHAIQEAGLWRLEYRTSDNTGGGNLPEPLKQRWTNFNQLIKFLVPYFENRNIKIEEISA